MRPSKHNRLVRTKKGRRLVTVNPNIRKRFKFKAHITPKERGIFNLLSDPSKYQTEFGGYIDFNKKGKLEQIQVQKGKKYEVELDPDYEVMYHTHPDKLESPPSVEDAFAILKSPKQQAEIVFRKGQAFILIKTPMTKALSKLPATQLKEKLDKAFVSSNTNKFSEESVKKLYESLGFIVYINNKQDKNLPINIKPMER